MYPSLLSLIVLQCLDTGFKLNIYVKRTFVMCMYACAMNFYSITHQRIGMISMYTELVWSYIFLKLTLFPIGSDFRILKCSHSWEMCISVLFHQYHCIVVTTSSINWFYLICSLSTNYELQLRTDAWIIQLFNA